MPLGSSIRYASVRDFDKTIGAWFLGPKAENHEVLEEQLRKIVRYFKHGRDSYFPKDPPLITQDMMKSEGYQAAMDRLDQVLEYLSVMLSHHSVPFSSPRYAAHVTGDTSLPATVGYVLGMLYNQNNVSPEASPLTGIIEYVVGQDLCHMLGFHTAEARKDPKLADAPIGWGHVTCDGSVANYESFWVPRSLKFYPLSLKCAIEEGGLDFVGDAFTVTLTGTGQEEPFNTCTPWELLNLKPDEILGLADKLTKLYDISSEYIEDAVKPYLAQMKGKQWLERRFDVQSPQYFVSLTKHYSINKAANILGIGEDNLVDIDVDDHARMDTKMLKEELKKRVDARVPIYGVLAIMGSTEHGAVDPLTDILKIRAEFEKQYGVSFFIHCDAAWGGYFTSIIRNPPNDWRGQDVDADFLKKPLLPYTAKQLESIKYADSVTLDSHKSGYCPYPAGGLCYRDERMRFLITTTSPYINTSGEGVEAMGTYGLEGSKPGAAPLAVWVSNVVLGLHMGGYGTLLSQAIISGVRYYTLWSSLSHRSKTLIVTPFNILPIEDTTKNRIEVDNEKLRLTRSLLQRPYHEVLKDKEAMNDITSIGSDLMINTFSCNFRLTPDGEINKDVAEANFLNQRIYERLSIRRVTDDMNLKPVIVVGSIFEQATYKGCLTRFKQRLGLDPEDPTDLHVYSSVAMSPFVMENLIEVVGDAFQHVAEEEIENCQRRIAVVPDYHDFIVQGTDQLFLSYMPMMYFGSRRQNVVITGKLPSDVMKDYAEQRKADPSATFTLHTVFPEILEDILVRGTCAVNIVKGMPDVYGTSLSSIVNNAKLSDIQVLKNHSLTPRSLSTTYPKKMPFYLYGTPEQQHIDHVLLKAPNAQLTSSEVKLEVDNLVSKKDLRKGLIAVLTDRIEEAMQPFSDTHTPTFFKPGASSRVSLYTDPFTYDAKKATDVHDMWQKLMQSTPIATGTLTLGQEVFIDTHYINQETLPKIQVVPYKKHELGARGVTPQTVTRDAVSTLLSEQPELATIPSINELQEILSKLRSIIEDPDILLSHDIENALKRQEVVIGNYQIVPVEENLRGVQVSRYFMDSAGARISDSIARRKEWLGAVQGMHRR
ncbi:PLP-dependent transferase [Laetiporus sulphureus 93-53]|uniref:PLP-dependent transferase n=1 Tax=Laetiporus sulphureus 93-53 TaxID=1314785 RepID=A0A165EP47_9APHY|nr:PLP-dependent transferase [Laetiporus sulphureus 93-53]KZT07470.1 PLP-dependent transferase [Laetiporus sulphureus 93-53]